MILINGFGHRKSRSDRNSRAQAVTPGVAAFRERVDTAQGSVEISAFFVASNHYHLLAWVPDAKRMADFMGYFQTNAAREVARLRKWRDKVWSRRYGAIVVSDEPAAQVDRLRYVLSNGIKEGLVARVEDRAPTTSGAG